MKIKTSAQRGYNHIGWLESYHSFSFASYYDPENINFSHLRVINEDWVAAKTGFGFHPHKDMEIVTFMLDGAIEHRDNLNNVGQLRAGKVQLMRAGTGIVHSEMNNFDEQAHLMQIWITPEQRGLKPGWWEKEFNTSSDLEIIAEPLQASFDIKAINPAVQGQGLKMAQQGYILKVSKEQLFDFNEEHVYIHALGDTIIEQNGEQYNLKNGDALYGLSQGKMKIDTDESFVLMFIFKQ